MTQQSETKNNSLLWARLYYFFFYFASAALLPFWGVYFKSRGLEGWQIGILTAISPFMVLVAAPLWGAYADHTRRHKSVLSFVMGSAIVVVLVVSQLNRFIPLLLGIGLYAFFASPVMALGDNAVMQMLAGRKDQYGRQRFWGAVGWGVAAPLSGRLAEWGGPGYMFAWFALFFFAALLAARKLRYEGEVHQESYLGKARLLARDTRWFSFLFIAFAAGLGMSTISNYLYVYLEDLGASRTVMGFALTMATISEMPVYLIAGWLLRRFSARGMFVFGISLYALRLVAMSFTHSPWVILLLQLMHGPTFAVTWVAGVAYADQIAPPGLGATAQGLFSAFLVGLGAGTGAFLGGVLYGQFGAELMYRIVGVLLFASLVTFLVGSKMKRRAMQGV